MRILDQAILILIFSLSAFAQSPSGGPYSNYFIISQQVVLQSLQVPQTIFSELLQKSVINSAGTFNLLKWESANQSLPIPTEPYNRDKHFGRWIDDSRDNNCLDTRGEILLRNSRVPVTYSDAKQCVIATGEWLDPYTNKIFRSAGDIQIDHFVPLKQTYTTGAWTWNQKIRCLYANYLFNQVQLLPVSGIQNQIKLDHAPDQYMPPNKNIWCAYLGNWLKVKFIWNLVLLPQEAKGIAEIFKTANCNAKDFQMSLSELQMHRNTINGNALYCDYGSRGSKLEN